MHIDEYRFGRIVIDDVAYRDDVIILAARVIAPWWRKAGGHVFAAEDLGEVLAAAPEIVVLGTGALGMVNVPEATLARLGSAGSRVIVARTATAVEEYNRLVAEGHDVAACLHLTC